MKLTLEEINNQLEIIEERLVYFGPYDDPEVKKLLQASLEVLYRASKELYGTDNLWEVRKTIAREDEIEKSTQ